MKISPINNVTFKADERRKNNSLLYPILQGTGALIGYSIPLKDLDGPDMINDMGTTLSLRKTKVPNTLGKWKNAFAGAFIGTGVMLIADLIINHRKDKK